MLRADEVVAATARSTKARETSFDLYAGLVQRVVGAPTGLVTLVEPDRQVFLGVAGLPERHRGVRETPLSHSICQYVVARGEPLVVTDARRDERVGDHLAVRDLGVVGYAGWPLTDHTGTVVGSLCAIDSRPRAWTEAELTDLEDLAAACSAELAQRGLAAELRSTVAELERSNVQLTAFAAQVSHDLRNPLSVLLASLEMIAEARQSGSLDAHVVDQLVRRALSSTSRMSDLVSSVLDFAVVDGRLSLEEVDVAALVASVLDDLAVSPSDSGADVVRVDELAGVRADPAQLRIVVQNLTANALKHGSGSPVSLSTRLTEHSWTLSVADHGPGIAVDDRDRVLEPLVQLDTAMPGSGLGLATCMRIAEVHGGSIGIHETPGGGATVSVTLPRRG